VGLSHGIIYYFFFFLQPGEEYMEGLIADCHRIGFIGLYLLQHKILNMVFCDILYLKNILCCEIFSNNLIPAR
jgi:hypothetical protein